MKIFLTSRCINTFKENNRIIDCNINKNNNFIKVLKENLLATQKFVLIANDFFDYESNDDKLINYIKAFNKIGIKFNENIIIDNRCNDVNKALQNSNLIFLSGGSIKAQMDSFNKINLKKYILKYNPILIGQSAGAMNCSKIVYNYPETEEELNIDKFTNGLGFTDISIIPHFNRRNGNDLLTFNINLINEYFKKDSFSKDLYALKDGSFISIDENISTIYGESFLFSNGKMTKICQKNKSKMISNNKKSI